MPVCRTPQTVPNAGRNVLDRVRKCFARADHPNANEAEARAAVKMASKIMEQHQIQQSDLMEAEDQSQREKRGGLSTVNILPATEGGKAFNEGWVTWLVGAMDKFFDCRHYSTEYGGGIEWTFYGIAEHTISAAIAFEAIYNQIQAWAAQHKGVSTRNSYSLGVCDGLLRLAEQEKEATEAKARQYEEKALAARIKEEDIRQQAELHRLRQPPLEISQEAGADEAMEIDGTNSYSDSTDDHNNTADHDALDTTSDNEAPADFSASRDAATGPVDTAADFDTELQKFVVPESTPTMSPVGVPSRAEFLDEEPIIPTTESEEFTEIEDTVEWKSMRQLSTYREMSRDIEASVLEAHNVKLRKGRKTKRSVKDKQAFKQGQHDSKNINVRAARIEEGHNKDDMVVDG